MGRKRKKTVVKDASVVEDTHWPPGGVLNQSMDDRYCEANGLLAKFRMEAKTAKKSNSKPKPRAKAPELAHST